MWNIVVDAFCVGWSSDRRPTLHPLNKYIKERSKWKPLLPCQRTDDIFIIKRQCPPPLDGRRLSQLTCQVLSRDNKLFIIYYFFGMWIFSSSFLEIAKRVEKKTLWYWWLWILKMTWLNFWLLQRYLTWGKINIFIRQ